MNNINLFQSFLSQKKTPLLDVNGKSLEAFCSKLSKGSYVGSILRFNSDELEGLSEKQAYIIYEKYKEFQVLAEAKERLIKKMEKENSLDDEIKKRLASAKSKSDLENIYKQNKSHVTPRSIKAKKAGLEPLAKWVWSAAQGEVVSDHSVEVEAKKYLNPAEGILTFSDALKAVESLLANKLMSSYELRNFAEKEFESKAILKVEKGKKFTDKDPCAKLLDKSFAAKNLYKSFNFQSYNKLQKGWRDQKVKLLFDFNSQEVLDKYTDFALKAADSPVAPYVKSVVKSIWENNILPSIDQTFHRDVKLYIEKSLTINFMNLLEKMFLSVQSSKNFVLVAASDGKSDQLTLLDEKGGFVSSTAVEVNDTKESKALALDLLKKISSEVKVENLVIQKNNSSFNKLYDFFWAALKDSDLNFNIEPVCIFSFSPLLKAVKKSPEGLGQSELTQKSLGAGWCFQDPMAALLETPFETMTFGGLSSKQLESCQEQFKEIVLKVLFKVGVDINSARAGVLSYLPGFNLELAEAVIKSRKQTPFSEKEHLSRVSGLSSDIVSGCSHFIYASGSKSKLATTRIPESFYQPIKDLCKEFELGIANLFEDCSGLEKNSRRAVDLLGSRSAYEFILSELKKPSADLRPVRRASQFRPYKVVDVKEGQSVRGIVSSINAFGVFVDLGFQEKSALLRSQELYKKGVRNPYKFFALGSQQDFKVSQVEKSSGQISLTLSSNVQSGKKPYQTGSSFKGKAGSEGGKTFSKKGGPHKSRSKPKPPGNYQSGKGKTFNNAFAMAFGDLGLASASSNNTKVAKEKSSKTSK